MMISSSDRVFRVRVHFLRRVALGMAVALVGLSAASGQAFAAPGNDGTSNTIQFGVTSAALEQAHQPAVVTAPAIAARLIEEEGIYPPFA